MASTGVRKLSKPVNGGSGSLLGQVFDDDSDCENDENRSPIPSAGKQPSRERSNSNGPRRRSSFGGARFKNEEEQTRIVDMYTNIIKLSSENKINEKNSWGLDLIDHMGKLIKADSTKQRGVNFQKASCTLDASVKIYSNRVDDTYSHSHRVLESFSRNADAGRSAASDDENDADPTKTKRAARLGANKASNRLNIGDTIEKNVDNINAKEIENDVQLDPMFHTISKLFDKGGAEGMLMYNLRVNPFSSSMALNQEGLPDPFTGKIPVVSELDLEMGAHVPATANVTTDSGMNVVTTSSEVEFPSSSHTNAKINMLDLTGIIKAANIKMEDLIDMTICPQLDVYRSQIHNKGREPKPTSGDDCSSSGSVRVGTLDPADFKGSHFFGVVPTDAPLLGPSVHSLTRDITLIPFEDMTEDAKEHTFANHQHAYFDAMAAMVASSEAVPVSTLFTANMDDIECAIGNAVGADGGDDDYDYDAGGGLGDDADDCDEEGNYVASERRATLAPPTDAADGVKTGNTRQSMLQVTDINGSEDKEAEHVVSKIQWKAVTGHVDITEEELLTVSDSVVGAELTEVIASGSGESDEYAFFDVAALMTHGANNNWAGSKHWKRASTRTSARNAEAAIANTLTGQAAVNGNDVVEDEVISKGSKKPRAKKAGIELDFSLTFDSFPKESLFKPSVSRGAANSALMTTAAIKKQTESAEEGDLFLPVDSKLLPKDLCRLFLAQRMVVPPPALAHLLKCGGHAKDVSTSSGGNGANEQDLVWGHSVVSQNEKFTGSIENVDNENELEYGNDDGVDYDDDRYFLQGGVQIASSDVLEDASIEVEQASVVAADEEIEGEIPVDSAVSALSDLAIDETKLVQVGRKVGKIDIGYSTVAKRINVKQLKIDIWREIAQLAGVEREGESKAAGSSEHGEEQDDVNSAPPAADFHATTCSGEAQITDKSNYCDGKLMSFQGLVNDLAIRQKQKDVSVSFYFICLLHLANEKTLKIEDTTDMNDLIISKD